MGMPLTALLSVCFPKSTSGLRLWTLVGLLLREMQERPTCRQGAPGACAGGSTEELWDFCTKNHFVCLKSCCV